MLLLRDDDVRAAMAGADFMDPLERALSRSDCGELQLPPRLTLNAPDRQFLRLMPAISPQAGYAGYKAMNFHPLYGVRYVIALTSLETGDLEAMLDADWVTAERTATTVAIAVRRLAPRQVRQVTMLGSGTQAEALLRRVAQVIPPCPVIVYSPTRDNRESFATRMGAELGLPVRAADDVRPHLREADVVLSAYRAGTQPIVGLDDVHEGALVCGISSVRPHHREVDVSLWKASKVIVDDREHVCESGDGVAVGLRSDERTVTELWEVLQHPSTLGRTSPDERILFKSVGTAEQDIALAAIVLHRARERGLGEQIHDFPSVRPIQTPARSAPPDQVGSI